MLVGARLGQGAGAALMAPAGLSILTTSFSSGDERSRALGVWGAISGLAAAAGVFLGGVLSQGPGWRWVLFVNLPVCALILVGAYRLVPGGRPGARSAGAGIPGAVLGTAGMLLLVYALVRASGQGWGSARTIGELATAAVVLAAFTVIELRRRDPLFPFSIFRVQGLAAADATQMIAFVSVFYFLLSTCRTSWASAQSGAAVIVAGALIAAAGVWYLSGIPLHGAYPASLLPGLVIMAIGIGAVLVSVTNAGVPADKAGLAAGLLNASQQLGTALGLAIFSAIATARTGTLLTAHAPRDAALTAGFHRALLACAIFLLAAAVIALRATNSRGEPAPPGSTSAAPGQVPAPQVADQ
jgi:MFS family permease